MKKIRSQLVKTMTIAFIGLLIISLTSPVSASDQQALVDRARITFESFMADQNMTWLQENLHAAKGLVIVPSLLKAGFIFGGSGGSGVLIVPDAKTGKWSEPAFYTIGSVTFGLQIGGVPINHWVAVVAIDLLLGLDHARPQFRVQAGAPY